MPAAHKHTDLYVGLMSGTSMDGIDAALVSFGDRSCNIIAATTIDYPEKLRAALMDASRSPTTCTVDAIGTLDHWIGECFRDAALKILEKTDTDPAAVSAIGSHGQTLRHQPRAKRPFTLQIGDPNIIVAGTGIDTVADFRRRDLSVGGEGAPLAPAFHRWLFSSAKQNRCVLNIGGIANVTILPKHGGHIIGFDTGPGNTLLDSWVQKSLGIAFDENGRWAKTGDVLESLLREMSADGYFGEPAPKSTGFEYFNATWIQDRLSASDESEIADVDVQATLSELSATTIATAVLQSGSDIGEVLVCGGGVHNTDLMDRLHRLLPAIDIATTSERGLDADWVEAAAFAWLAKRCLEGEPGNLPSVTGASKPEILGAIYKRTR